MGGKEDDRNIGISGDSVRSYVVFVTSDDWWGKRGYIINDG